MTDYVNDSIIGITYGSKGGSRVQPYGWQPDPNIPRDQKTGRGGCSNNGQPCPDDKGDGVDVPDVPQFDVKVPESNSGLDPVVIVAAVGLLLIIFKKRK